MFEVGQVWSRYGSRLGDIDSYQIVFVKGENAIAMNCATLNQVVIYGEDQRNSFTFDCELTEITFRIPRDIMKQKGFTA
jgi:hypothetical protein